MSTDWTNKIQKRIKPVWKRVEKHNLLTAIGINVVFLLLVLVFCEIKYETSDDYIMAAIMSGAYNATPNPHMIFINILWGYLLLPFYNLMPQISWYLISQLLLCFCSFTAVTYMLLKRLSTEMGIMLSILFITFFSDDAYIMVQFTKTAILAVMAGSILFLQALLHKEVNRKKEISVGVVLVFLGSLVRFSVIYIAGGFLLLILAIEFVRIFWVEKDRNWRWGIQIAVAGFILIGFVFGARQLDRSIYKNDEAYAFFREYGSARGGIVDARDYGYEVSEEEYKKAGLSANDYKILRTWNFGDPDFYTLHRMTEIKKIISDYQKSLELDRDAVKEDLKSRNYWSYPSLLACLLLSLLSIVFNKRYWWASLLSAGGGYLYLYYFAASGRMVYRIEYSIFLCVFLTGFYFWRAEGCRKLKNKLEIINICGILIMMLCVYQTPTYRLNRWAEYIQGEEYKSYIEDNFLHSWNYDSRRYRGSTYNKEAFSELRKEVEDNSNNFYFLSFNTAIQTLYLSSNPMKDEQEHLWKNSAYLSGVTTAFPEEIKLLNDNNVKNPLKNLVNNNVYLVDNLYQEEILKYIQEHYYPKAEMKLYKTIDGFQIWKFNRE